MSDIRGINRIIHFLDVLEEECGISDHFLKNSPLPVPKYGPVSKEKEFLLTMQNFLLSKKHDMIEWAHIIEALVKSSITTHWILQDAKNDRWTG